MIVPDVNVLVHAHREEMPHHDTCRRLLDDEGAEVGWPETALLGFLRLVTHPRVFGTPTPLPVALATVDEWVGRSITTRLAPGPRHQEVFSRMCREIGAAGNDLYDAHLAALAVESRAELWSFDRGFARFPGLRWRTPA